MVEGEVASLVKEGDNVLVFVTPNKSSDTEHFRLPTQEEVDNGAIIIYKDDESTRTGIKVTLVNDKYSFVMPDYAVKVFVSCIRY